MSEALAPGRRDAAAAWALTAAALALMAAGMTASRPATAVVGAAVLVLAAMVVARPVLPWSHLLVALVLVILFIPIRRYTFPGKLPFQLEPYRVLVAFLIVGWVAALLIDRRVRLRRSGLEGPILLIVFAVAASIATNPDRVSALQPTVLKAATFFLSFIVVFYLVLSVVPTREIADRIVRTLVAGGAVVAALAVIEARTGFTPFTRLDLVLPFLQRDAEFDGLIQR